MTKLEQLRAQRKEALAAAKAIQKAAKDDGDRDLTDEELAEIEGHVATAKELATQIDAEIERANRAAPSSGSLRRSTRCPARSRAAEATR
jgi:hypothetical protein